jgi:hypothetical protein
MLDEEINVTRAGAGDECTHEKLRASRSEEQNRRTLLPQHFESHISRK